MFVDQRWMAREQALEHARALGTKRLRVNILWARTLVSGAEELRKKLQNEFAQAHDQIRALMDEARRDAEVLRVKEREAGQKDASIERERAKVREAFLEPISEALPGRKVMRFYQIENKIDAVLRYELARSIPVVEQ